MTWLTLWLKKIILLVLLAAFLDLILPNTSLQRYVKMVMGLILLLTIISPVFSLFNLSQEELALQIDRYQAELDRPADAEWKRIAEKLAGARDKQVRAYVQKQVEEAVRARVKEAYGLELSGVNVTLEQSAQQPELRRIELIVGEERERSSGEIKPIEPFQPVHIDLSRPPSSVDPAEVPKAEQQDNPLYRRIARDVAQQWGLTEEQVVVLSRPAG
ncbi:stage III sporulation protein AF [Brevibacillus aydinogluensis]|jgi:stage III sporulation protein AF|uniref:Stage III sporulation protein AF n=1 Tax=Brevibacillus aydinogluensis TaxID=927786 RepID=A0AA48REM8_9BACL|nr:stage III sporulation protein AF [Brevibacillus aydinogluensis]MDT3415236.1 stage III sporulation protein AF [Brevibacillus aydinogluensis]CAJ1002988.1 stage III sporulation protein AF [Brevibacillus aydinogluensis]